MGGCTRKKANGSNRISKQCCTKKNSRYGRQNENENRRDEVRRSSERIGKIEKIASLETEMFNNKKLQDHLLMVDCKLLELLLQFRRVPDKQGNIEIR